MIELLYEDMELTWGLNGYKPSPEQRAVHEHLLKPNHGTDPETGESGPLPTMAVLAGGEQCLPAGTLIQMADGSRKPIEQVSPGDSVFAVDEETLCLTPSPVAHRFDVGD